MPSLSRSSEVFEKFSRKVFSCPPAGKNEPPGTKATFFSRHLTSRSRALMCSGRVTHMNRPPAGTHRWIAVGLQIVNYQKDELDLQDVLSATLSYGGKYLFETGPVFTPQVLKPLVRSTGYLVFRVPNLVAEAELIEPTISIDCAGTNYKLKLMYRSASPGGPGDRLFFDEPQEAALYFMEAIPVHC